MRIPQAAKCITAIVIAAGLVWPALAQDDQQPAAPAPPLPAQAPEAPLPPLDELMERALDQSPDIAAARAELQRAEAELRRVEMDTVRQLTTLHEQIDALRAMADELRKRADLGSATFSETREMTTRLAEARAQLQYLVGAPPPRFPHSRAAPPHPELQRTTVPRPEVADPFREKLDQSVSISFDNEALLQVLEFVTDYLEVNFIVDPAVAEEPVTVRLNDVPLRQALLALADMADLAFVIRDYGVFATTRDRAMTIEAPSIPEDLPLRHNVAAAPSDRFQVTVASRVEAPKGGNEVEITISVDEEGELFYGYNDRLWPAGVLAKLVDDISEAGAENHTVLIRPDDNIPIDALVNLINHLKQAGITRYSVAAVPPKKEPEMLHIDDKSAPKLEELRPSLKKAPQPQN
jgi:biopolymer transport protein ExbD